MTVGGAFYQWVRELALPVIPSQKYKGTVIGVDASMLIHMWMSRDPHTVQILKQYWQMRKWIQRFAIDNHGHGITIHFVFDGRPCPNKAAEDSVRADKATAAMAAWGKDKNYWGKARHVSWDLKRACTHRGSARNRSTVYSGSL